MRDDDTTRVPRDQDIEIVWEPSPDPPPPGRAFPRRKVLTAAAVAVALVAGVAVAIALIPGGKTHHPAVQNAAAGRTSSSSASTTISAPGTSFTSPTATGPAGKTTPTAATSSTGPSDATRPAGTSAPGAVPTTPAGTQGSAPRQSATTARPSPTKSSTSIPIPPNPVPKPTINPQTYFAALPGTWVQCAVENAACNNSSTHVAAFGQGGGFAYGIFSAQFDCTAGTFGASQSSTPRACYTEILPQDSGSKWVRCATESYSCNFAGVMTVAFGADGKYTFATLGGGGTPCTTAALGDPDPRVYKACYYMAPMFGFTHWNLCAGQGGTCSFSGRQEVAYGNPDGKFAYKFIDNTTPCDNSVFGDPAPTENKDCYYQSYP